ncbi:MAG: shikimate dehydrogenase [Anaerolineales bacterium]|nr:shikimate dehydrogenase [Anaerolineales bacterium]
MRVNQADASQASCPSPKGRGVRGEGLGASQSGPVLLGLTGYPLGHSLSPRLHNAALQVQGLPGKYRLFAVPPTAGEPTGLLDLLAEMRAGRILGLNVTIPHKQTMIPLLDQLTTAAAAIGAVNTVFCDGQRLLGDNTDAPGFWSDLQASLPLPDMPGQQALVLGAGGAARAVCYALLQHGWQVTLAARRPEQARALGQAFQPLFGEAALAVCPFSQLSQVQAVALLVNATPLGMYPQPDNSPWPADLPLPAGAAVYDLVYNPRQTRLVRQAQAAGLSAAGGLGMLVEQAALAWERWFGQQAPRQAMWSSIQDV